MRRKVIIDCDPGIDDSLALMLALSMEEVEVVGITIVCGNSPAEMGFGNAKKVLKHMNRLDVPVFMGAEKPMKREYVNALDTHGEDGLGESFLPEVPGYRQEKTAVGFMSEMLRAGDCSVIALGPMTNLAELIETDREAFDSIEELVSMGGSFKSHGNCSPVAEYNYWEDPDAAARVYRAIEENAQAAKETVEYKNMEEEQIENPSIETENLKKQKTQQAKYDEQQETFHKLSRIHMVGLDVTRKIVLTPDLLEYMNRLDSYHGEFVRKITKFYYDFHWEWEHLIGCVINDPLAVAYFANRSLCSGFESYVDVETGGISMGQTVVDAMNFYRKTPNAVVLTQVDSREFFYFFFGKILGKTREELDLMGVLCGN
jgi:purine nucleosidase